MKISTVILSASVALNLALLGAIGVTLSGPAQPGAGAQPAATAARRAVAPAGPGPQTWASLGSAADLASQRDRLRAQGFPDAIIRAILAAEIREKYAAQRRAIEGDTTDQPFWKMVTPDPKVTAALRALSQAERKEMEDLLGPAHDSFAATQFEHQIPGLSSDKAQQLADISQRYNKERSDIFRGGTVTAADQAKLAALDKAMHDEFAAVLSPQELEQYDLRAGRTAVMLQYRLAGFDPSEAEYRALYNLQSAFDAQYGQMYGPMSPDEMRARMAAQNQLQADIATALGPDRFAQYERASDYSYRQTTDLVARLQLPPATADNLYALQKEYQQKATDLYNQVRGQPVDRTAMQQQLAQLQQEATARVSTLLNGNAEAIDAYQRYGGQWLRGFAPSVPVRGGAPAVYPSGGTVIYSSGSH